MNTNTPPTQLASPVVPGEEEAPLVADDVAAVEEAMHDAIDEDDDDPLQYLNTGAYDDGGIMAQQYEYSGFERDELVPELTEDERIIGSLPVGKKHRKTEERQQSCFYEPATSGSRPYACHRCTEMPYPR